MGVQQGEKNVCDENLNPPLNRKQIAEEVKSFETRPKKNLVRSNLIFRTKN